MSIVRGWTLRDLRAAFGEEELDNLTAEELLHLACDLDALVAEGYTGDNAGRELLLRIGGRGALKGYCRVLVAGSRGRQK